MNILLRLPIDLACAIASEWLGLKFLSFLDMAYCNKEQRPSFLELIRCCVVPHLPNVREDSLLISWATSRAMRARELSIFSTNVESCLVYLAKCGKSIRSIKLYEVAPITTNEIIHAIAIQSMHTQFYVQRLCVYFEGTMHMLEKSGKYIKSLGFSWTSRADDSLLTQAISYCPNVLHLDLSLYRLLTDASLESLALHLTHLRTINVSCCNFTDQGLTFLSHQRRDTLQGLFASECHRLTGAGFNAVLQNCHQLHTLGFNLVPQVTNTLDAQLLRNIRTLQTDFKCQHAISEMLLYFTQLENLYLGNYFIAVLRLPATGALALSKVILGVGSSYSHGNRIVFGYHSSQWSLQQNKVVAALHAQRPNLHVRYEMGNAWPSNFMNLPV